MGVWKDLMNPFPFFGDPLSLVTLEIAVGPSGEIRISEIVAVGGVDVRNVADWIARGERRGETSIYIALTNQASERFK